MKHKLITIFFVLLLLLLTYPLVAPAELRDCIDPGAPCITYNPVHSIVTGVLRITWQIFVAVVVVCFVVAGILFLTAQGNPEKLKTARQAVIWGVAGIIVGILAYSAITVVGIAFL